MTYQTPKDMKEVMETEFTEIPSTIITVKEDKNKSKFNLQIKSEVDEYIIENIMDEELTDILPTTITIKEEEIEPIIKIEIESELDSELLKEDIDPKQVTDVTSTTNLANIEHNKKPETILNDHFELEEDLMTISPKRKNSSGKLVQSYQKQIIVNIYKDIRIKSPDMKFRVMVSQISQITGIGRNTVISTISEYRSTGTVSSPNKTRNKKCCFEKIDDLDRNRLRQKVHSFWLRHELPTFEKVLQAVNEDPALPKFKRTTLYNIIKKLEFTFTKRRRYSVLTEKEKVLVWRRNYLYDICKYRAEGRSIYYLDETWLNSGDNTVNKDLTTGLKKVNGKGKQLIVLHIGSDKGFLPGGLLCFESKKNSSNYHNEINGYNFQEWFESIIPLLSPNSVIVMDYVPYHCIKSEKIPTTTSNKSEMLTWLTSKGVIIDRPMTKAQLLFKIHELKPKYTLYVIDNIAKDAGHTVLRLPPYHFEFNPMKLAWAMVKDYVTQHNKTFKINDVRTLLNTSIEQITSDDWKNFINHIIKEENKMWTVDDVMDEMLDQLEPYAFTITGDTSSFDSD